MSEAAAAPRFTRTWRPLSAYRKAVLAPDREAPAGADRALALAKAVLAPDRDAPGAADRALALAEAVLAPDRDAPGWSDYALALASCRVTAVKAAEWTAEWTAEAAATVNHSVDPGHRLRCDHERPSDAEPGDGGPARPGIFRKHSFN